MSMPAQNLSLHLAWLLQHPCKWGLQDETQVHLFFKCEFASVFWFPSPLQLDVTMVAGEDFISIWQHVVKTLTSSKLGDEVRQWFVFGLWRLRKCRNLTVFEDASIFCRLTLLSTMLLRKSVLCSLAGPSTSLSSEVGVNHQRT